MVNRRQLLGSSLLALVALGGCAQVTSILGSTTQTIEVSLANAQAESGAILSALTAGAAAAISSGVVAGGAANTVKTALTDLTTAVTAFQAVSAGGSYAALAQSVVTAANGLLPLLPIDPAAKTAIALGLTLLSALIGGLTSLTLPAPAATTPGAVGAREMLAAPIPIPVPTLAP